MHSASFAYNKSPDNNTINTRAYRHLPVQLLLVLPAALPNTPGGHGVQEEFVAPPLLYVPAGQLWGHATALPASQ